MSVSRRASFAAGIAAVRRQKKTKMSSNREHLGEVAEGEKTVLTKYFHQNYELFKFTQNCRVAIFSSPRVFSETANRGIIYTSLMENIITRS